MPSKSLIIDLIFFDFDGVMTNNRVFVFDDGHEAVVCNRADGLGCDLLNAEGITLEILSTETNPVVEARARKLNIVCTQGIANKEETVGRTIIDRGLDPERIMFVGNDINDLAAMKRVGWPVAPADAHADVRTIARHVTKARGGEGVVREIADFILKLR